MTDAASRAYQPTPLHARTAELCATNAWVEECGFTVPALYTSPAEEQHALTFSIALSDLSARQCWLFDGPDAGAFLSFAMIDDVSRLAPGQVLHTAWCDDMGFARGIGVVARLAETQFELSTGVRDFAWFADGVRGFDAKVANVTGARAIIGVQGPLSASLLNAAGLNAEPLSANNVVRPNWRAASVALMRDAWGDGFELSMQGDDGVVVWDRLWRAGAGLGVAAVAARALETMRIERGLAKAGVDWLPAQLVLDLAERRRVQDIGFVPDLRRRFNGVEALRREPGQARPILVQFAADEPLASGPLTLRGLTVGRLTSQAWSETRASAIAIGSLDADALEIGTRVAAPGPHGAVSAEIVRPLFARPPSS